MIAFGKGLTLPNRGTVRGDQSLLATKLASVRQCPHRHRLLHQLGQTTQDDARLNRHISPEEMTIALKNMGVVT
jgi:hypothetical protein